MNPAWLYLIAGLLIAAAALIELVSPDDDEADDEPREPFGFQVYDGGVVDGGEPVWESE